MAKKNPNMFTGCFAACFVLNTALLTTTVFAAQPPLAASSTSRIAGHDRYETSVEISKAGWKTSDYAIISRGDDFADALCAAPLAKKWNAPILLTEKDKLNSKVEAELHRLGVKKIFIIGGKGALSQIVESQLASIGQVERIAGTNRYATSAKIAEQLDMSGKIALATGKDYADALSMAAIAAKEGIPILLTEVNKLPSDIKGYIKDKKITKSYVIGGTSVVGDSVLKALPNPERIAGKDRFDTNVKVMKEFEDTLDFDHTYVAVGSGPNKNEFADALAGSVLAAKNNAPVALTYKTLPQETETYLTSQLTPKSTVTVLGGEAAVPQAVMDKLRISYLLYNEEGKSYGADNGKDAAVVQDHVSINAKNIEIKNMNLDDNLYIYGDHVKIANVKVKGTIFVDPGENGTVDLTNVQSTAIRVRSGAKDSVHLNNVQAGTLSVESRNVNNAVRVESTGSTKVDQTYVKSTAVLQADGGSLGKIEISNMEGKQHSIELRGTYDNSVFVNGRVSLHIAENASVPSIKVASEAEIKAESTANVGKLEIAAAPEESVKIEGKFKEVAVESKTTLNIASGTTIGKLTALPEAKGAEVNIPKGVQIEQADSSLKLSGEGAAEAVKGQTGPISGGSTGNTPRVSVTGVSISGAGNAMYTGDTLLLTAVITPSDATDKSVTWSSSNTTLAAVDPQNGTVTAKLAGTVTITATTNDGHFTATYTITITQSTKDHLIEAAVTALNDLPNDPNTAITNANLDAMKVKVLTARQKVAAAKAAGAVDADFGAVYGRLAAAQTRIDYLVTSAASALDNLNSAGGVVNGDITLFDADTYGPNNGNSTVNGDLTIAQGTDGLSLSNVVVTGILYINPGDNASVFLNNVQAREIRVLSGGYNSVHLDHVQADQLTVSQDDTVRVVASNGTNITNTSVQSGGRLENDGDGTDFGTLNIDTAEAKDITLSGSFSDVNVNNNANVQLENGSEVNNITTNAESSEINVGEGVAVHGNITVADSATDTNITLGTNSSVEHDITINGSADVNLGTGTTVGGAVTLGKAAEQAISDGSSLTNRTASIHAAKVQAASDTPSSSVTIGDGASVNTLTVNAAGASVNVAGQGANIGAVTVQENASGASISVNKEASVQEVAVNATNVGLKGEGTVANVSVASKVAKTIQLDGCTITEQTGPHDLKAEVTNSTGLAYALTNADVTTITIKTGNYNLSETRISRNLTITGEGDATVISTNSPAFFTVDGTCTLTIGQVKLDSQKAAYAFYTGHTGQVTIMKDQGADTVTGIKSKLTYTEIDGALTALETSNPPVSNVADPKVTDAGTKISVLLKTDPDYTTLTTRFNADVKDIYITAAHTAVTNVPLPQDITAAVLQNARDKIKAAKDAIAAATGKLDKNENVNFDPVNRLKNAEDKINAYDKAFNSLQAVPDVSSITLSTLSSAKAKVKAAQAALGDAISVRGWSSTDFTNYARVTAADNKIFSIDAANTALAAVLPAEKITYQLSAADLQRAKDSITNADNKVQAAKNEGALDSDFIGLQKLQPVKDKIAQIEKANQEKAAAITEANDALAQIIPANLISLTNLMEVQQKVQTADTAVQAARGKGAVDSDFINVSRLQAAKDAMSALLTNKTNAIQYAKDALAAVPDPTSITEGNITDAKIKVQTAQSLVDIARAQQATDSDLGVDALDKLRRAGSQITALETALKDRADAVKIANDTLSLVPAAQTITLGNMTSAKEKVQNAEDKITAARAKGAVDKDFTGLDKLTAAKDKIAQIQNEKDAAIRDANSALAEVTKQVNTTVSVENVMTLKQLTDDADAKVQTARSKGAADSDFQGLSNLTTVKGNVNAWLKNKKNAADSANAALAALPPVNEVTISTLADAKIKVSTAESLVASARARGVVDSDFIGLSNLAAVKSKIASIEAVVNLANNLTLSYNGTDSSIALYKGTADITVSWSSDVTGVIDLTSGNVTRAINQDKTVVLTATISKVGVAEIKKSFTIVVKALTVTVSSAVSDNNVKVTVSSPDIQSDAITVRLYKKGTTSLVYSANGTLQNGKCVFQARLDQGEYEGKVTGTKIGDISIGSFKVIKLISLELSAAALNMGDGKTINTLITPSSGKMIVYTDLKDMADSSVVQSISIIVSKNAVFHSSLGNDINLTAGSTNTLTLKDLGIPDNDPPGVTLSTLRSVANTNGDILVECTLTDSNNSTNTLTFSIQLHVTLSQLEQAIKQANTALNAVPDPASITYQNVKTMKVTVQGIRDTVNAASRLGAKDYDFIGLDKLKAAETKIQKLEKDQTDALKAANDAIAGIPVTITWDNLKEAKAKAEDAAAKVDAANTIYVDVSGFVGLDKLVNAEATIKVMERQQADAVTAANNAIQAAIDAIALIPAPENIDVSNVVDAQTKVKAAQAAASKADDAVSAAQAIKVDDAQLTKLQAYTAAKPSIKAAQDKIDQLQLSKEEAIEAANDALQQIPAAADITLDTVEDARVKVDTAEGLVKLAEDKGAVEKDLIGLDKLKAAKDKIKKIDDVKALEKYIKKLQIQYNGPDAWLELPRGDNDITVEWAAEPRGIIDLATGSIRRLVNQDQTLDLTAVIKKEDVSETVTLHFKVNKIEVTVSKPVVNGSQVTISVSSPDIIHDQIAIKIYNKATGAVAYADQMAMENGQCTFTTDLDIGEYEGIINGTITGKLPVDSFVIGSAAPLEVSSAKIYTDEDSFIPASVAQDHSSVDISADLNSLSDTDVVKYVSLTVPKAAILEVAGHKVQLYPGENKLSLSDFYLPDNPPQGVTLGTLRKGMDASGDLTAMGTLKDNDNNVLSLGFRLHVKDMDAALLQILSAGISFGDRTTARAEVAQDTTGVRIYTDISNRVDGDVIKNVNLNLSKGVFLDVAGRRVQLRGGNNIITLTDLGLPDNPPEGVTVGTLRGAVDGNGNLTVNCSFIESNGKVTPAVITIHAAEAVSVVSKVQIHITGNNVTVTLNSPLVKKDTVTVKIYKSDAADGQNDYVDQIDLIDGKCEINTQLDPGEYEGVMKGASIGTVSIPAFTVGNTALPQIQAADINLDGKTPVKADITQNENEIKLYGELQGNADSDVISGVALTINKSGTLIVAGKEVRLHTGVNTLSLGDFTIPDNPPQGVTLTTLRALIDLDGSITAAGLLRDDEGNSVNVTFALHLTDVKNAPLSVLSSGLRFPDGSETSSQVLKGENSIVLFTNIAERADEDAVISVELEVSKPAELNVAGHKAALHLGKNSITLEDMGIPDTLPAGVTLRSLRRLANADGDILLTGVLQDSDGNEVTVTLKVHVLDPAAVPTNTETVEENATTASLSYGSATLRFDEAAASEARYEILTITSI